MGETVWLRRQVKIHALRGSDDEADGEASFAVPDISASVMASWEFISAINLVFAERNVPKGLDGGWALMFPGCDVEGAGEVLVETRWRGLARRFCSRASSMPPHR